MQSKFSIRQEKYQSSTSRQAGSGVMLAVMVLGFVALFLGYSLSGQSRNLSSQLKAGVFTSSRQLLFELAINRMRDRAYLLASAETSPALKNCLRTANCPGATTGFRLVDPLSQANNAPIFLSSTDSNEYLYDARGTLCRQNNTPCVFGVQTTFRRAGAQTRFDATVVVAPNMMRNTPGVGEVDRLILSSDPARTPNPSSQAQRNFFNHFQQQSVQIQMAAFMTRGPKVAPKCASGPSVVPTGVNEYYSWTCGPFVLPSDGRCEFGQAVKRIYEDGRVECGGL